MNRTSRQWTRKKSAFAERDGFGCRVALGFQSRSSEADAFLPKEVGQHFQARGYTAASSNKTGSPCMQAFINV